MVWQRDLKANKEKSAPSKNVSESCTYTTGSLKKILQQTPKSPAVPSKNHQQQKYLTWQHAYRQDRSKSWSVHTQTSLNHDLHGHRQVQIMIYRYKHKQVQIMIYRYKHKQVQIMICTHTLKSKSWLAQTQTSPNHDLYTHRQVQIISVQTWTSPNHDLQKNRQVQTMTCARTDKSKSWSVHTQISPNHEQSRSTAGPQNWKCLAWPHLSKVRGSRRILVIMCLSVPFRLYSAMATCCTKQEQLLKDCEQ